MGRARKREKHYLRSLRTWQRQLASHYGVRHFAPLSRYSQRLPIPPPTVKAARNGHQEENPTSHHLSSPTSLRLNHLTGFCTRDRWIAVADGSPSSVSSMDSLGWSHHEMLMHDSRIGGWLFDLATHQRLRVAVTPLSTHDAAER
jgi:hypothetical protein